MKWVEPAGLVKFDFLGLKTLTVIEKACDLIGRDQIDIPKLPLDDKKTFELLARGDGSGVFQLEGNGMRDVLRKLKPDRFEDIIAVVALYRPGPMENIPSYIKRKHGEETPDYLHPMLEGILKETYGIMIYQEQVMQIAQVLSGYTLGGADLLRRAMGKKIQAEMDAQRSSFVDGAEKNGVKKDRASSIFDQVDKFAGYGFNKSHAAAYALVCYQTAYLKANHPVEFFAATMTLDMGNVDKLNGYRRDLEKIGVELLPPDVTRSTAEFTVETTPEGKKAIRYALAAIKGVGREAMNRLVAEREENGPFKDLFDFAERLDQTRAEQAAGREPGQGGRLRHAEQEPRPDLRRDRGACCAIRRRRTNCAVSNQNSLFGDDTAQRRPQLPKVPDWAPMERLQQEFSRDRLLSLVASAGRVRKQPEAARRDACCRPAGAAAARHARPHQARRHRDRPAGAHLGQGQPLRLRAVLRPVGRLRAHGVQRGAERQAQSSRSGAGGADLLRRPARRRAGQADGAAGREARGRGRQFRRRPAHRDLRSRRARGAAQVARRQARAAGA